MFPPRQGHVCGEAIMGQSKETFYLDAHNGLLNLPLLKTHT